MFDYSELFIEYWLLNPSRLLNWGWLLFRYEETGTLRGSHQISTTENHVQKSRSCPNDEQMTTSTNCLFIIVVMLVVVGVLMLGFYFRGVMGKWISFIYHFKQLFVDFFIFISFYIFFFFARHFNAL